MTPTIYPWHVGFLAEARALASTRHHAWLVVGRGGDGVGAAAEALAASLLCHNPHAGLPCGECGSCRWLAGDAHPDFRLLAPDIGDAETVKLPTIKVDMVREAIEFMQLSASTEQGRVLLVNSANALTRESGNTLLKALEEPPPNTRWLLVSSQPAKLLPTIRSRALRLNVPEPAHELSERWLAEKLKEGGRSMSTAEVDEALKARRGAPLDALNDALSSLVDMHSAFAADLSKPGQLPTLKWGAWVESGAKAERRERFLWMLRSLLDWTADWARVRGQLAPLVCIHHERELAALAQNLPLAEGLRYHRSLLRAMGLPDTTLSARLQIEKLLLEYRALFAR